MKTIVFPKVSGKNLKREKLVFPKDFPAKYNLVLMAFYRHQQLDINTWLPYAEQLEDKFVDVKYVELPVIYKLGPIRQFLLNEGMRAGIPDQKARERTITLYLDKALFFKKLEITSEDEIQIMLVTAEGKVLWRETGIFSKEKASSLTELLQNEKFLLAT
ncbi:MAG: hypothetical protein JXB38_18025 [Anaerolineales bacterium]|nr:hypothetical protein [Anaerolineales bacterium]